MEIIACALSAIAVVLVCFCIYLQLKNRHSVALSSEDKRDITEGFSANLGVITQSLTAAQRTGNEAVISSIKAYEETASRNQQMLEARIMELVRQLDLRMSEMSKMQENKLEQIKLSTEGQMRKLQEDNARQLDKMRETVDEKLSKTINERFEHSFKMLSSQLENVYKSLGEMQNVATNVNSLTKVLSNVKTTGIFGEIQLGAILEQILTREQYVTNFVTGSGRDPVEYAVKLPGQEDGSFVYLPIDSKFPLTVYNDLYNACESNRPELIKQKRDQLKNTVKSMAKDIKTKYVYPPRTTAFAVMFLPTEGLYAEVAKMGLIEELQQSYGITIAGPTTMSALLSSLQMGFKTLAIQKKSGEVWKVLGAVKTEFAKYSEIVGKIQAKFESTSKEFDQLVGTRTRVLQGKLRNVETLDGGETSKILGLPDTDGDAED